MKKILLFSLLLPLCVLIFAFISPQSSQPQLINNISVQFILTNGYGNNVYVDNFILGTQYTNDVAVSSINNVPKDTNYLIGSSSYKITPKITVTNVGTSTATNFGVVMVAGTYSSTKTITSLASGVGVEVIFDSLTIAPNSPLNIVTYSTWASDQNRSNDTLRQYSLYMPGIKRNVLIEAFTQWNCGPCASNTPYLDQFQSQHWDTLCVIRYHVWWPGANNDPMYLANSAQNDNRINYYGVSGVPDGNMDGTYLHIFPYSPPETQFGVPYYIRLSKGTPIGIHVTDTRIAGDTIKSDITLNIVSPLVAGNYRLRVNAVERIRSYTGGTNGETSFKDIFRRMYPDVNGFAIPTAVGTYNYTFKYLRESAWIDSLIYTVAFIQNDVTKEIINCDKGRRWSLDVATKNNNTENLGLKPMRRPFVESNLNSRVLTNGTQVDNILSGFNFEVFESAFPPTGWTIVNPDAGLTWEQYNGANGPLLGGTKSARVNCYSYGSQGQIDYLKSKVYNNVDLTDSLKFNWAHAVYSGYTERMQVQVSTNGGTSYPYTIFDKSGANLATAPATSSDFIPAGASQWGRFSVVMSSVITAIHQFGNEVPTTYALNQNYPNPFNPATLISYMIPKTSKVSLKVYDLKGQLIETLFDGTQNAGNYILSFDGSKLASGVYFYRLVSDNFSETKKMLMVK
jgi:hypothetical protein